MLFHQFKVSISDLLPIITIVSIISSSSSSCISVIVYISQWSVCSCGRSWRPEPEERLQTSARSTWTSTGPTGTTSCSCTATTSSEWVQPRGGSTGWWCLEASRLSWRCWAEGFWRRLCLLCVAGSRLCSTSSRRTPCTTRWVGVQGACAGWCTTSWTLRLMQNY